MKRVLVAVLIALAVAAPAATQESHRALAERVVKAGYEAQIADRIMEVFWPVAEQAIRDRAPTVNPIQLFQYENKLIPFAEAAARAGLVPLVDYFDRVYTDEALATIAAFFESEAGKKFNGAQGTIAGVLQGPAGEVLNTEISGLRTRLDELLKADGL
jgi:hypothetical protein